MKENLKKYSIQFIKEIIPVIAGILIALFIENWNSERKDKAYIDQVFTTVNSELKDSKEDIKTIIPKQEVLLASLDTNVNNKNISILNIIMESGGFYLPQIKTNAWQSVSKSKIDLVDYKKIAALSRIEDIKSTLNNKSDLMMSLVYSNINATDKDKKETLKMILKDIIQTEKTALKVIEDYEKH